MATSSSDESSTAPKVFHISSSIDSGSRSSPNKQKCPLCNNFKRVFYCKECVHSGLFYRSNSKATESYVDKRKALLELDDNKRIIEEKCLSLLESSRQADVLRSKIRQSKDRTRILALAVEERRQKRDKLTKQLTDLKEKNEKHNKSLPRYEKKVQQLGNYVAVKEENADTIRENLQLKHLELKKVVKTGVQQLVKYIFPIVRVERKPEMESSESDDMVTALAEASRTTYIRDNKWEYTENSSEFQYSIIAPTLPGSGNYSLFNLWVAQNRDSVPGSNTSVPVEHNPAYSISAALTYTAQLVQVLSFYLNTRLPYKMMYSDFCNSDMNEQQFARRVARLNANILHLCFTQNVDLNVLRSCNETVHNILQLLNVENTDLGREGPIEVDVDMAMALEKPLSNDLSVSEGSDSEEGDTFPNEWEAVPHVQCPEAAAGPATIQSTQVISTQQASSMAGGLVNSAAASIASIWRGFTGR